MAKYHVKPDGTVGICKAKSPSSCKFKRSEAEHFDSKSAAQRFADIDNSSKYGLLPGEAYDYDYYANKWAGRQITIPFPSKVVTDIKDLLSKTDKKEARIRAEEKTFAKKHNWDYWGNGSSDKEVQEGMSKIYNKYKKLEKQFNDELKMICAEHSKKHKNLVSSEMLYNELTSYRNGGHGWVKDNLRAKMSYAKNGELTFDGNPFW